MGRLLDRRARARHDQRVDIGRWVSPWTEPSGCRPWLGALNGEGRAVTWDPGRRQSIPAARALWEQEHGALARGLEVLHLCDLPLCVELSHLVAGTAAANTFDRVRKQWSTRGTRPSGSALPLALPVRPSAVNEARAIRARHRARLQVGAVQLALIA